MMENVQVALLEQGAEVSAADRNGDTALHYAARNDDKNGAKVLCEMLLEFGAAAAAVNNAGKTALDIATEIGNEPLVKLLLAKI
jgi:ankyrin repeat protein